MIAKLAFANVKRSYKEYSLYFITLLVGVAVFYAFNSISSQQAVLHMSEQQSSMLGLVSLLINEVSIFIVVILTGLVVYANRFLIKRRNKEFGLYLLMGMTKSSLFKMMLLETFFMGLFSLFCGLVLGLFLAQALTALTASLFAVKFSGFTFFIAYDQIIKTVVVFFAIFVVALFVALGYLMKARLITLLQSEKKNEAITVRSIPLLFFLFLLSCLFLGSAYYLLIKNGLVVNETFTISTVFMIVGTVLFFFSLSGFLLHIVQKIKRVYYRNLNMFAFRQIASRFNTSFVSMSVICIILFFAITSVCSGMSVCSAMTTNLKETTQYDATAYAFYSTIQNEYEETSYEENKERFIQDNGYNLVIGIKKSLSLEDLEKWNSIVKDTAQVDSYEGGLTFADLDKLADKPLKEYSSSIYESYPSTNVAVIGISQFNQVRAMAGLSPIELASNEALFNSNNSATKDYLQSICRTTHEVYIFDSLLTTRASLDTTTLFTSSLAEQTALLIVPDEVISKNAVPYSSFLDIALNNESNQEELTNLLKNISSEETGYSVPLTTWQTKQEVLDQAVSFSAIVSYLAIYIGFILVVACAAILAIQQLTDVSDSVMRYRALYKLGASKKMVTHALLIQIGVAFMAPLALAIAHSVCAMSVVTNMVSAFGLVSIVQVMATTLGVFLLVYGAYFMFTYVVSRRMIREG